MLTLRAEGTLNQWRQESVDLAEYAGESFYAAFYATLDDSVPTTFRVNDVSIRACGAAR